MEFLAIFLAVIIITGMLITYTDEVSSCPKYNPELIKKSKPARPEPEVVNKDEEAYRRRPLAYLSSDKTLKEFYNDMGVEPKVTKKKMSDGTPYEVWDLGDHDFI